MKIILFLLCCMCMTAVFAQSNHRFTFPVMALDTSGRDNPFTLIPKQLTIDEIEFNILGLSDSAQYATCRTKLEYVENTAGIPAYISKESNTISRLRLRITGGIMAAFNVNNTINITPMNTLLYPFGLRVDSVAYVNNQPDPNL